MIDLIDLMKELKGPITDETWDQLAAHYAACFITYETMQSAARILRRRQAEQQQQR